jgi:DNA-binding LytR/AlgR family response regulator
MPSSGVVFIKSGYELIKVTVSDILFIRSDADYTEVFTPERKYLSQEPLRYWEEHLDGTVFMRIHKSYILNISKIEKIIGNQVRLDKHVSLPIGRAYKEAFMKQVLG